MLYEFTCSNYKSIKDVVKFSMLATSDDRYEDTLYRDGKNRFLRVASIYGANGSGKSTFLNAIAYMKFLVSNSISFQPGDSLRLITHKLCTDLPSIFTIQFEKGGIRYAYGFSIQNGEIVDEYLYYFPNSKKTKIFERTGLKVVSGNQFRNVFTQAKKSIKENRLFLSLAANFSDAVQAEEAFRFIREDLIIYSKNNNWKLYSYNQYQNKGTIYNRTIAFLKGIDTGIQGFHAAIEEHPVSVNEIPLELLENIRGLESLNEVEFKATIDYGVFNVSMEEESTGIQKLISIMGPVFDIIDNDKVLLFDEMECGLHESIAQVMIKLFRNQDAHKKPQLIFTTHDTSLLDAGLFRRDQIWFTELSPKERATSVYSLAELKNVRKIENYKNGYISGKYGAIPMLRTDFEKVFDYE